MNELYNGSLIDRYTYVRIEYGPVFCDVSQYDQIRDRKPASEREPPKWVPGFVQVAPIQPINAFLKNQWNAKLVSESEN